MNKQDLKILFLGTPEFAVGPLKALVDGGYRVEAVVTMPDKIAGRGHKLIESDVKKFAVSAGLPVLQPEKLRSSEFINELRRIDADLFIVIAFRMLPEIVWSMPRFGTFNLHASLLPRYRGAAPINRAIMNGEKETGVTTFFLKHEIDTGDIIGQERISIGENENVGSLYERLMKLGTGMVLETVDNIIAGDGKVATMPQPDGEFVPAPKIFTETCLIDWTMPRENIRNLIRGLSPYPAAFTYIENAGGQVAKLKVFEARAIDDIDLPHSRPGDIHIGKHLMAVRCGDGWLELTEVQLQGKKRMAASSFLLGYTPASKIPELKSTAAE